MADDATGSMYGTDTGNSIYSLPRELTSSYDLQIAQDLVANGISNRERTKVDAEIDTMLNDPTISEERKLRLLEEKREIDSEPKKQHHTENKLDSSSSDSSNNDDSPNQELKPATQAQIAGLLAMGLSPNSAIAAMAAANNFVQFVFRPEKEKESTKVDTAQITSNELVSSAQDMAVSDNAKQREASVITDELPVRNTSEERVVAQKLESTRKEVAQSMKDESTRTAPVLTTAADRRDIEEGSKKLTAAELERSGSKLGETTAEILRNATGNNNEKLARKIEDSENPLAAKSVLVMANVSENRSGQLPSQKLPATERSRAAEAAMGRST